MKLYRKTTMMMNVESALLIAAASMAVVESSANNYTFAIIPKNTANIFFEEVQDGCEAKSSLLPNVSCLYIGPDGQDAAAQAGFIDAVINGTYGKVDGISVSVTDADITGAAIDRAMEADIPVITFDSDAKESSRYAYIGTNNYAFGIELGKLIAQIAPSGGKYGILAAIAPNVLERVKGVRERLAGTKWIEVESSFKDCEDSVSRAVEIMHEFAAENVDGIIAVGGWPMYDEEGWKAFVDSNRDITLTSGDALPVQLKLMNKGYVNGLVGQLPFEMGEMSIEVLLDIVQGNTVTEQLYGTALLEVMRFPLELPELNVDQNYIGNLAILGYVLFALIAVAVVALSTWICYNKSTRVVRASQPFFLQMILFGVIIQSSAIIPLAFETEQYQLGVSCMSVPWLITIGFTTIFAALYAKLKRINLIFHNPNKYKRVKITEKDVMKPYLLLMLLNIITLACWTAMAPLTYQRFDYPGTDDWNRVIATYGICTTKSEDQSADAFVPFLAVIVIINVGTIIVANVQAYHARSIQTEYSESKYITIIMASMLQACALGVPCLFLLWNNPPGYFTVLVMLIFCISAAVLMFMFYPKMSYQRRWRKEKEEKDRRKAELRSRVIRNSEPDSSHSHPTGVGGKSEFASQFSLEDRRSSLISEDQDGGLKIAIAVEPEFRNSTNRQDSGVLDDDNEGLKVAFVSPPEFKKSCRLPVSTLTPSKTAASINRLRGENEVTKSNSLRSLPARADEEEEDNVDISATVDMGEMRGNISQDIISVASDTFQTLEEAKEEIKRLQAQISLHTLSKKEE